MKVWKHSAIPLIMRCTLEQHAHVKQILTNSLRALAIAVKLQSFVSPRQTDWIQSKQMCPGWIIIALSKSLSQQLRQLRLHTPSRQHVFLYMHIYIYICICINMYLMALSLATLRHHWEPPKRRPDFVQGWKTKLEETRKTRVVVCGDRCIVAGLLAKWKEILLKKTSRIVPCLCKCVQKRRKKSYTCKQEESADTNTPPMVLLMVLRSERRISWDTGGAWNPAWQALPFPWTSFFSLHLHLCVSEPH